MDKCSPLPDRPFLKTAEVARLFNVDLSTVFLWTRKGRLRPIRTPGGTFRFAHDDVQRLLEADRPSKDDRRKEPRFGVSWPVMVRTMADGLISSYEAEARDMSASGMGLLIHQLKTPRKTLSIAENSQVTVLNSSVLCLKPEISAQVRFCRRINDTDTAVGLLVG